MRILHPVQETCDSVRRTLASQNLIVGAKTHAALKGKYAPDQEDVRAVAFAILRHRIVKNYKAEAEGISEEQIITDLFW